MNKRKIVSVVGDAVVEPGDKKLELAYQTGKLLVDAGFRVQSGGNGGVMEAAFKGAHASENYRDGDTIAIVPSFDAHHSNQYADIVIPTGLDISRNVIVANSNAVIAIGGGAGTLSEMAYAWTLKRLIVAFKDVDGWSDKMAGLRLDKRNRYPEIPDDKVFEAYTAEEAIKIIKEKIDKYDTYHAGIAYTRDTGEKL